MPARACADCGSKLPTQTGAGKPRVYCESCSPARRRGKPASTVSPLPHAAGGKVEAATRATLESAGRLDTVAGAAALALAEILDSGGQSGSSAAALVKELRATIAEALEGVRTTSSLVDELRARRDAKRGA